MNDDYQRPKTKRGQTITAVWWNRDGTLRWVKYEPTVKAARHSEEPDAPAPRARGIVAAERATRRAAEPDLFARP